MYILVYTFLSRVSGFQMSQSDIRDAEETVLFVREVQEQYELRQYEASYANEEAEETGAYLSYFNVLWQSISVVS